MVESIHPRDYAKFARWICNRIGDDGVAVVQFSGVASRHSHSRGRRKTAVTDLVFQGSTLVARGEFTMSMAQAGLFLRREENLAHDYV